MILQRACIRRKGLANSDSNSLVTGGRFSPLQLVMKIKAALDAKQERDGSQFPKGWVDLTEEMLMNILLMFRFSHPLRREGAPQLFKSLLNEVACERCKNGFSGFCDSVKWKTLQQWSFHCSRMGCCNCVRVTFVQGISSHMMSSLLA
jgi:hypothetical protein